ncbi:MAG: hypothetical protein VX491_12975 [Pseudomonadota bacterium]|nr:hypothetical protein [Pseudomonadota bacterium]
MISSDPVPAVIESEATGEIKEIFDDIKNVTGVDVVNLVWRRLAITKDALCSVWDVLRPVYKSGLVNHRAYEFRKQLVLPELPKLHDNIFLASGIDSLAKLTIINVLASYNRTNSVNLIALQATLIRLTSEETVENNERFEKYGEDSLLPLPRLPAMSDFDPNINSLVEELNLIGEEDGTVIASMYRHLAYWPSYLALIRVLLEPLASTGQINAAIEMARQQSVTEATFLSKYLAPFSAGLSSSCFNEITNVLELFTRHPLSKMVVICGMLLKATQNNQRS